MSALTLVLAVSFIPLFVSMSAHAQNDTDVRLAKISVEWKNCKVDSDCPSNAACFQGRVCQCNIGYIEKNSNKGPMLCLPKAAKIGDQCEDEMQCEVAFGRLSECYRNMKADPFGTCRCREKTQFRDGMCFPISYIGGNCVVADHCYIESQINGTIAHCSEGKCVCPPDHHPTQDKKDCVKNADFGAACKSDDDCVADQTECVYEECHCKVKYVVNQEKTRCLPVAMTMTDSCIEDQQCKEYLDNTVCDKRNKVCMCIPTAHQVNEKCLLNVPLLNRCDDRFECIIPSLNFSLVDCNNGICLCANGYKISPDNLTCLEDPSSGTSLTTSISLVVSLWAMLSAL